MVNVPTYDVFSGTGYGDAKWLEAAKGLTAANQRMQELAEQTPGPYFVFSAQSNEILAAIDTTTGNAKKQHAAS
jgi:hypothetical protein